MEMAQSEKCLLENLSWLSQTPCKTSREGGMLGKLRYELS